MPVSRNGKSGFLHLMPWYSDRQALQQRFQLSGFTLVWSRRALPEGYGARATIVPTHTWVRDPQTGMDSWQLRNLPWR